MQKKCFLVSFVLLGCYDCVTGENAWLYVFEGVKTLNQLSYCYRRGRLNPPEDIHVNRLTPKVVTAGLGGFNPPKPAK